MIPGGGTGTAELLEIRVKTPFHVGGEVSGFVSSLLSSYGCQVSGSKYPEKTRRVDAKDCRLNGMKRRAEAAVHRLAKSRRNKGEDCPEEVLVGTSVRIMVKGTGLFMESVFFPNSEEAVSLIQMLSGKTCVVNVGLAILPAGAAKCHFDILTFETTVKTIEPSDLSSIRMEHFRSAPLDVIRLSSYAAGSDGDFRLLNELRGSLDEIFSCYGLLKSHVIAIPTEAVEDQLPEVAESALS